MKKVLNKKGFSLIELIFAVVILGVLTSVAVPLFSDLIKSQKAVTCQVYQQSIYQAYQNWKRQDDIRKEDYDEDTEDAEDDNPFKEGVSSFNSSTDVFEDCFKESFVDGIGGIYEIEDCPSNNNYYIISWDGNLEIECYDKNGNLVEGHNNSDLF